MSLVRRHARTILGVALAATAACTDRSADARQSTPPARAGEGGSPVSLDSALALFRQDLEPITGLENAASSADAIVARLVRAVERSDTVTLRAIVMSRREFAWLYYPTSVFTRAPMKQEPGLVWFMHTQQSEKGVTRLMGRYGGRTLRLRNTCAAPAKVEGRNTLWFDCVQRIIEPGSRDTTVIRLFGGLIRREGTYKIFSYSNDL